ncbi:hypothetical protein [Cereibacter johrii]|uniref:Protein NO VEIN C-terminal domain-containing protein n=1 Tax=Cereibacter johrii TaxID=445629 RepID=A0ABX5J7F3_9RHOB|nr:hypothetical protein [Cereibacter johrii]PTM77196.1 hypothetical protein C8J29_106122 [Cereibacter johrii]
MTYTTRDLDERGAKYLLAFILEKIEDIDQPFVTYGQVARLLERQLQIPRIFPVHIGTVAGAMMKSVLQVDENAPPINALVAKSSGVPGEGFASFYDDLWRERGGRRWLHLRASDRVAVIQEIREAVRQYPHWDAVYQSAFGERPQHLLQKIYTERDGKPPEGQGWGGEAESEEHRRLKEWAKENPAYLGLDSTFIGIAEKGILSGDRLDVFFSNGHQFAVAEVKSILSSDDDLRRGLYQCVKYRAVIEATELPVTADVRAILLTERDLPADLKVRAKMFNIETKVYRLNS